MAVDPCKPRWKNAYHLLEKLPIEEKRRFYSKAVKYFIDEINWSDALRSPDVSDHQNTRDMINAFNSATRESMLKKTSHDTKCQWEVVSSIRRGKKRRTRKKQISRFTYEMMFLIRLLHPAGRPHASVKRQRVKGMSTFQKELKQKYFY